MGKKARKTRWRTLAIADEQSDSEESNTTTAPRLPNAYQQKSHYHKVPYSSQSTPRRRYQHDGTKSTRSSSTASENKITFNEDEYTRITTPRQDVLFKKGYLNKPRSYQTQTSTGTSTTSTGNSTGNGTPDHQSTDLEYESQFVFPNGFVDQNGIYYVNSFEPYPLMLYNPPTYYTEFSNCKSKRYSTGSLTESTSPNNEEATSQDMSGGEASNNVSDYSSHRSVYSMYPEYYANGNCPPQEMVNEHCPVDEIRKIKKRRRRKTSKSLAATQDSSECSEDESESCTEESRLPVKVAPSEITTTSTQSPKPESSEIPPSTQSPEPESEIPPSTEETSSEDKTANGCAEETAKAEEQVLPEDSKVSTEVSTEGEAAQVQLEEPPKPLKYDLKPDAEEFIPRAYRAPEIPLNPIQFIKVPPNFVHIPVVPYNGQNFNPAFIPSGIPIHFLPPDQKMFPNFVGFPPNIEETREVITEIASVEENRDDPVTAKAPEVPVCKGAPESQRTIDIATVVSKLEEAAKELVEVESVQSPKKNNEYKASPNKYKNTYKRSFYNSARSSPQRQVYQNGTSQEPEPTQTKDIPEGSPGNDRRFNRYSPEKFKKNWKAPNYQNGTNRWQQNGVHKSPEFKQRQSPRTFNETKENNRNYSDTLRNPKPVATSNGDVAPEAKTEDSKTLKSSPKTSAPLPTTPNQWISVSSKKKRKNRNAEESDATTAEQEEPTTVGVDDDFEVYDINQLVDVVPPTVATEEVIKVEITEGKVEEIISTIAESLPVSSEINQLIPNMRSVTDIESELISKEPEQNVIPEHEPPAIETIEEFVAVSKPKSKKKSKKGAPKAVTKRVIITDIDLSDKCEPVKTPAKQQEQIEEKPEVASKIVEPTVEEDNKEPPLVTAEAPQDNEEEEKKKSKKKKKKPAKSVASDGAAAAPIVTESYDFLLEASLVDEVDKTNDEISQELDKIIQKGMYSNLEEKMKSLNIDESDGFFKSVFSKITTRDGCERTGYAKTPDFTKIPLFKPASVSEDHHLENKQSNKQLPASESPREDGIFLDNPDLKEMLRASDDVNKEIKLDDTDNTKDDNEEKEPRKLYPITAAVREWMSKTRETTPDVEILKSPKTIYEELHKNVGSDRNFIKERSASVDEEKEEITVFAKEEQEDLLDFWENEVTNQAESQITNVVADKGENVEEGEDVLEVYESKYGRNEDYLNLQKEVREKAKSFSHPKHSNLPYRAVCCNVM